MIMQENSSETNISSVLKEKVLYPLRYIFITSKTLPFICALVVSYTFVEMAVLSILMDYITDSMENEDQRIAAIVTNMQDGLSSIFFVFVSLISEAYAGCFTMIAICAASSITGLGLLWRSASPSALDVVYVAIFFLALGNSAQKLSEIFLEYQLEEKIKERKEKQQEDGSTQNNQDQELIDTILTNIWLFVPLVGGYIITLCIAFIFSYATYKDIFRFATFLMLGTYMLFLIGSVWYRREELPPENNLRKIVKIWRTARGKLKLQYPISEECYYWKGYKQNHFYNRGEGVRLKPHVPRLFRWLDKAAIIVPEVSPEIQEKNGKLCMVKEVREVKSLVPMFYMCFSFIAYSLLMATANTFFVAQASRMMPVITSNGNDISVLFLIKAGVRDLSRFTCFLIKFAFGHLKNLKRIKTIDFMSKRKAATITRIGVGMVCAVICSFIAWRVEAHRLSLPLMIDEEGYFEKRSRTSALVPQFLLLGMSEGLLEWGLVSLFQGNVAKSMWDFEDSFTELVMGVGKLFIIPFVLIFSGWFRKIVDFSHLDKYYLLLGILNIAFIAVFAYYSIKYTYKEECPEDEEVTMEENNDEAQQLVDQVVQEINRINGELAENEDENEDI